MKKLLIPLALLAVAFLVLCGTSHFLCGGPTAMTLRLSDFSEETQDILDLLGDDIVFFDYAVDESIQSMAIRIWTKENGGEWTESGGVSGPIEAGDYRFGVRVGDNDFDVYTISQNGHTRYSKEHTVDFSVMSTFSSVCSMNETQIVAGTEIPLWTKMGFETDGAIFRSDIDFRESDCDVGVAVTVIFSAELLE